jgi:hypothetical protein
VEWLIPRWLAAGELTVLYGKGDTYKSFIALTWACQLAAAGRVVIYIAAEGASGLRGRIGAWQVRNGVASLRSLLVIDQNLALHNPDAVDAWQSEVSEQLEERDLQQPDLVVVDTVARNFVGGDENSARDMGAFVEGCETIRRTYNAAVLPIHHTRKDDTAERGTESLRNASFAMLSSKREGAKKTRLSCVRMKDAQPPAPILVEFAWVPLPWLSVWQGELISSLAMTDDFPPQIKDDSDDGFLRAVLEALAPDHAIGMEKVLAAVRAAGVRIGAEKGRARLKHYASDPKIPIVEEAEGGFRRESGS